MIINHPTHSSDWHVLLSNNFLQPISSTFYNAINTLRPINIKRHFAEEVSWIKRVGFWFNIIVICSHCPSSQDTLIGSAYNLASNRRQAIMIWMNCGLVYWRVYTPLGLDELMLHQHMKSFKRSYKQEIVYPVEYVHGSICYGCSYTVRF